MREKAGRDDRKGQAGGGADEKRDAGEDDDVKNHDAISKKGRPGYIGAALWCVELWAQENHGTRKSRLGYSENARKSNLDLQSSQLLQKMIIAPLKN